VNDVLALRHVDKRFGQRRVLNDVGIELREGHLTLLLGPNGAGKSTLLKIVAGLEAPDGGQVTWRGQTRPWGRLVSRFRREVVYLHQDPYLFRGSVRQNLAYGLRLLPLGRSERETRLRQALEWTGLGELANEPAHRLSGGQRQRVALARAWVLRPRALLLDEPTASLDPAAKSGVRDTLEELKRAGVALLVTTHEPQHLQGIENACLRLQDARLNDETNGPSAKPDFAFDH
jgi:tungstate transport system ATP-binding protein